MQNVTAKRTHAELKLKKKIFFWKTENEQHYRKVLLESSHWSGYTPARYP